jgi:hypothetical protein
MVSHTLRVVVRCWLVVRHLIAGSNNWDKFFFVMSFFIFYNSIVFIFW